MEVVKVRLVQLADLVVQHLQALAVRDRDLRTWRRGSAAARGGARVARRRSAPPESGARSCAQCG